MKLVTIDGPSGSGKSTVARAVASELGVEALDTGAMYRAVTVAMLRAGADLADEQAAAEIADVSKLSITDRVELDGRDVTREIRSPEVTAAVSTVAAHPAVRRVLVQRQRAWVKARGGGVVEGRDIGTVVFPEAPLKVFLTASDEERARRRHHDQADGSRDADLEVVKESLRRRDERDSTRAASPLQAATDALVIDTTGREAEGVVREVLERVRGVLG